MTLSVTNGTLQVPGLTGLTISGSDTDSLDLSGPGTTVNQALAGLRYTAVAGFSGADTLSVAAFTVAEAAARVHRSARVANRLHRRFVQRQCQQRRTFRRLCASRRRIAHHHRHVGA